MKKSIETILILTSTLTACHEVQTVNNIKLENDSLATSSSATSQSSLIVSQNILNILKQYALTYHINMITTSDNISRAKLPLPEDFDLIQKKIQNFVEQNKSIILTIIAFPYKSSNVKSKVLSSKADGAERHSLVYIQTLLNKIKAVYAPGAKMIIFPDGIPFCDVEKVSDERVLQYEADLKILAKDLPDIIIKTMTDLCPGKSPIEIRALISKNGPSFEAFKTALRHDKKLQDSVTFFTKLLRLELEMLNLTEKELKDVAINEVFRDKQLVQFVKDSHPKEAIKCSTYWKNGSYKLGLKISDSFITAYHGVLVETEKGPQIVYLRDVDMNNYDVVTRVVNGLPIMSLVRRG